MVTLKISPCTNVTLTLGWITFFMEHGAQGNQFLEYQTKSHQAPPIQVFCGVETYSEQQGHIPC
jgi:hypothetical protein